MTTNYLFAGFGGQGILFAGKLVAYKGLIEGMNVSWLPSYGPEMRGGTANCSIIVSDSPIGAPIVLKPDVLIAMNLPSLDKYENNVVPGGKIFVDSSLINRIVMRKDVKPCYVPATRLASENNIEGLANIILLGKMLRNTGQYTWDTITMALEKCISARHKDLLELNQKALALGCGFGT